MDEFITLSEAARLVPGRPTACAVWRWCRVGVKIKNGDRIKLHHVRFGGRLFTTEAALRQFSIDAAAGDEAYFDRATEPLPKPQTGKHRERSQAEARATLKAAGIL